MKVSPEILSSHEDNVDTGAVMERRNSLVGERLRLKDRILESINRAIKQIQEYQISSRVEVVTLRNNDRLLKKLCEHLDHALLHGLRHITKGYWQLAQQYTRKDAIKEIQRLTKVTTDLGKGRAWLYMALNENLLECYIRCFSENLKFVRKYYVKESLLLDDQRLQILLTMTSGLEFIQFQLEFDAPFLDLSSFMPTHRRSVDEYDDERISLCSMSSDTSLSSSFLFDSITSRSVFDNDKDSIADSIEGPMLSHSRTSSVDSLYATRENSVDGSMSGAVSDSLEVIRVRPKKKKGRRKGASDPPTPSTPTMLGVDFSGNEFIDNSPINTSLQGLSIKEEMSLDLRCKSKMPSNSDSQDSGVGGGPDDIFSTSDPLLKHVRAVFEKRQVDRLSPTSHVRSMLPNHTEHFSQYIDFSFAVNHGERSEADGVNQSDVQIKQTSDLSNMELSSSVVTSDIEVDEAIADFETSQAAEVLDDINVANEYITDYSHTADCCQTDCNSLSNRSDLHLFGADLSSKLIRNNSPLSSIRNSPINRLEHSASFNNSLSDSTSDRCVEVSTDVVTDNSTYVGDNGSVGTWHNASRDIYSSSYPSSPQTVLPNPELDDDFDDLIQDRRSYYDDRSVGGNREDIDGSIVISSPVEDTPEENSEDIDDNLVTIQNGLLVPLLRTDGDGASQGSLDDRNLLGDGRQVVGSSQTSTPDTGPRNEWDIKVDNNTMLYLMLDVFQGQDEQFHKMYRTSIGHTEGEVQSIYLLLTDRAIYILMQAPADVHFYKEAVIFYRELDYISLSLNYQTINIVCTNRRKQFWITSGEELLTKNFLMTLDHILRTDNVNLPNLSVLTDATTQKIALQKWLQSDNQTEVKMLCYSLVYWEDPLTSTRLHYTLSKEGILYYKEHGSFLMGSIWRAAYFVLKDGVFYQYDDQHDSRISTPKLCLPLNSEECSGVRRNPNNDRPHCFDIILASGATMQLSACNDSDAQSWLLALCQSVAEGISSLHENQSFLACCCVLTNSKLLMCHEDVQTSFFRALGSTNLTDLTSVNIDNGARTYLILDFESTDNTVKSGKWVLYFASEYERDKILDLLSTAWSKYFQVSLPVHVVEDVCLQRKCREGVALLKRPQNFNQIIRNQDRGSKLTRN